MSPESHYIFFVKEVCDCENDRCRIPRWAAECFVVRGKSCERLRLNGIGALRNIFQFY